MEDHECQRQAKSNQFIPWHDTEICRHLKHDDGGLDERGVNIHHQLGQAVEMLYLA